MSATTRGRVRLEQSAKRVRVYLGGVLVADTINPTLVWEVPYYPTYYIPCADIKVELTETGTTDHSPSRGDATLYTVKAGGKEAVGAARSYLTSPIEELRELVRFDSAAMDSWFEEDEEIYVHPRDPYTRVDVLASSRHIRVEIDGTTVAESTNARLLFETGLPTRYYLPKTAVRMDLLEPSDTQTHCPYKGSASYHSARIGDKLHEDIAWYYDTPLPESQKVTGLIAFYDEKVDTYVDGVLQERPKTVFA
ncbi:DUF427 domain-containing protein [Actinocrispum wychmicini]|uniref:Uncharacterized protein (DUF427 family) n=1 Tax=Actinocrispum wychmicini TaxID=1213861 RepID=A0A4R2JM04_9PSEU|nr:DUF427 domain-containing protein [Actinocrispum wychmicini]TCO55225.1 uncharacterized protein (DUF427 family) [Actinocrispum wychmicini]